MSHGLVSWKERSVKRNIVILVLFSLIFSMQACGNDDDSVDDTDTGTGGDSDTDSDTDTVGHR